MATDVEKNACIHFVDERDFKEVSVIGKRKSKKNRAIGFVLTGVSAESASEDDEVESDCSSEIGSSIELALSLMKTAMKVAKKVVAALKNSQKTKKRLKRSCIQ